MDEQKTERILELIKERNDALKKVRVLRNALLHLVRTLITLIEGNKARNSLDLNRDLCFIQEALKVTKEDSEDANG